MMEFRGLIDWHMKPLIWWFLHKDLNLFPCWLINECHHLSSVVVIPCFLSIILEEAECISPIIPSWFVISMCDLFISFICFCSCCLMSQIKEAKVNICFFFICTSSCEHESNLTCVSPAVACQPVWQRRGWKPAAGLREIREGCIEVLPGPTLPYHSHRSHWEDNLHHTLYPTSQPPQGVSGWSGQ